MNTISNIDLENRKKFFSEPPDIGSRRDIFNYTNGLLKEYALQPKKSLGQHFMIDPNILVAYADLLSSYTFDSIVEIGAGLGTLTKLILQGNCDNVFLIEKDPNFALILEKNFRKASVINSDVLTLPNEFWNTKQAVIGNIPYEISSPLLFKLAKSSFFNSGVLIAFLVQKEFAQRMIGLFGTKNYSKLSVNIQLLGKTKIISHFGPGSFYPAPKIASSLVVIFPHQEINPIINSSEFQQFLTILFTRKNRIVKSLLKNHIKNHKNRFQKEQIIESDPEAFSRVKNLSPDQFIKLFERMKDVLV
ncbi:MAG: putative ribosomal RNA small subunit methyltransferase A [Candidatus Heimdallarchaeota archaeon LC_3]|nr:MAG: putative ribosomal RNA small subunit methyltransferase A [Candidatus Heimdallarchaeota archaeon LC_3]